MNKKEEEKLVIGSTKDHSLLQSPNQYQSISRTNSSKREIKDQNTEKTTTKIIKLTKKNNSISSQTLRKNSLIPLKQNTPHHHKSLRPLKKKRYKSLDLQQLKIFLHIKKPENSEEDEEKSEKQNIQEILEKLYDEVRHGKKLRKSHRKRILQKFKMMRSKRTMLVGRLWNGSLRNEIIKLYNRFNKSIEEGTLAQAVMNYTKPKYVSKDRRMKLRKEQQLNKLRWRIPDTNESQSSETEEYTLKEKEDKSSILKEGKVLQKNGYDFPQLPKIKNKGEGTYRGIKNSNRRKNFNLRNPVGISTDFKQKMEKFTESGSNYDLSSYSRDRINEYFSVVSNGKIHQKPRSIPALNPEKEKLNKILRKCENFRTKRERQLKSTMTLMKQYYDSGENLGSVLDPSTGLMEYKKNIQDKNAIKKNWFRTITVDDYFKHENLREIEKKRKQEYENFGKIVFKKKKNKKNELEKYRKKAIRNQVAPVIKSALVYKRNKLGE